MPASTLAGTIVMPTLSSEKMLKERVLREDEQIANEILEKKVIHCPS
jgi:hypothetical protein